MVLVEAPHIPEYGSRGAWRPSSRLRYGRHRRNDARHSISVRAHSRNPRNYRLCCSLGNSRRRAAVRALCRTLWHTPGSSAYGNALPCLCNRLRLGLGLVELSRISVHRRARDRRIVGAQPHVHRRYRSEPVARPNGGVFSARRGHWHPFSVCVQLVHQWYGCGIVFMAL